MFIDFLAIKHNEVAELFKKSACCYMIKVSISESPCYKVESVILKDSIDCDFILSEQKQVPQPISLTFFVELLFNLLEISQKHI